MIKSVAEKLINNGVYIIPLLSNKKHNLDNDILTKDYKVSDVYPDGNLGINLKKSGWYCIDLDSNDAIYFGNKWLPRDTRIHGRINKNKKELTHWFYKADGSIKENNPIKNEHAELFVDHNIVVFGSTINKDTKLPMKRFWESDGELAPFNESILDTFNLICLASAIAPRLKSANTGCLKLDSCLMRYTDWNDSEREKFLLDFYERVMPNDKEVTPQKIRRHIRANNRKKKNAGYTALAKYIQQDPVEVKKWLSWIGNVPEDSKYEKIKSFIDFDETSIDMVKLRTEDIPEMQYAVRPILPEGLILWAGRPKGNKSWKALDFVYCVQNRLDFLGHKTIQGDCLYLSLEDNKRRLKSRQEKLALDKTKKVPKVCIEAPYLGFGLEESIESWIENQNNPRLIVIDTLSRIKKISSRKNATTFDLDNELLRDLQKLAMTKRVTIVIISHLSKETRDYSWDQIQGSVGMQGITDAMWLIDRGDTASTASIKGRGRDIMDFEYAVTWNDKKFRYEYGGQLSDVKMNENRAEVLVAMRQLKKEGKNEVAPREVNNHLGYAHTSKNAKRISKTMQRMRDSVELGSGKKFGTYRILPEEYKGTPPWAKEKIDFEADKIDTSNY